MRPSMTRMHTGSRGEHQWLVLFVEVCFPRNCSDVWLTVLIICDTTGRKLKCDGRNICTNCAQRNLECVYKPVYVSFSPMNELFVSEKWNHETTGGNLDLRSAILGENSSLPLHPSVPKSSGRRRSSSGCRHGLLVG